MKKNYLSVMLFQLLTIFTPILSMPYIARKLGPEMLGRDAFVGSIVQIFSVIIILSIDTYGKKQMAQSIKANDVFLEIYSLQLLNTVLVMLAYFFFVFVYQKYTVLFLFYGITLFSTGIDCAWFFIGKEQISRVMYRNIGIKVLNLAAIFLFIKNSDDLWLYVCVNGCSLLLGQIVLIKELVNEVGAIRVITKNWKNHILIVFTLFIVPSTVMICTSLNKILLAFFVSEIELGYYNQAYKLYTMIISFMAAFSSILVPRIAMHFIKNEHRQVKKYIHLSLQLILTITLPIISGIVLCGKEFIGLFLGKDFLPAYDVLLILAPSLLIKCLVDILGVQYLVIANKQKGYALSAVVGSVTTILVCSLFLLMGWGIKAPAAALLLGNIVTLGCEMYLASSVYSIRYFCRLFLKYGSLSLVMGIVIFLLGRYFSTYSLMLKVFSGIIIYLGTLFLMNDSGVKLIVKRDGKKFERQTTEKNREPNS